MTRTRTLSARAGYTLVELLVVMSLIILLAALALGVSQTGMFGSQKVISAGDRVSGWLLIAKQRAVRDGLPRGVRFFNSPTPSDKLNAFTEAQYIESPDAWVPNQAQELWFNGGRIVFCYQWKKPPASGPGSGGPNVIVSAKCYFVTGSPVPADSTNWVLPPNPPQPDYIAEFDQRVTVNNLLVIPELGKSFLITAIFQPTETVTLLNKIGVPVVIPAPAIRELTLLKYPDLAAAGTEDPTTMSPVQPLTRLGSMTTYKFAFQGPAQPLLGEPALQLTGGTAIDFRFGPNTDTVTTPLAVAPYNPTTTIGVIAQPDLASGGNYFDILFSPSGQVLNNNAGLICLWVRDTSKGTTNPRASGSDADDPVTLDAAGPMVLVVVNTKNGLISTQEIIPSTIKNPPPLSKYDPYRSAKDGINNGL